MSLNVHIVHSSYGYAELFKQAGCAVVPFEDAELIVFTGGADVSPSLYGAKQHGATGNDPYRDSKEKVLYQRALEQEVPMVGICRGGQFLNVMSGGQMYQHVDKHGRSHHLTDLHTGEMIYVSSTHHQMIKPSPDAIIIATANEGGEREWYEGQVFHKDVSKEDIEVVYYPKTNSLCFQPHPEFIGAEYESMQDYFFSLLDRCLDIQVPALQGA